MSAAPQPTAPGIWDAPYTEEEGEAMLASVIWFRGQRSAGNLTGYEGMNVAVLGETIIDADRDIDELARRLDALGGTVPVRRVAVQYVPAPGEWDQLH